MRLPWPSRRSNGRSTGGAAAASAAAGDGTQPGALSVGRTEWRDVGTLHPSFQADPGVRVQRFRERLAGSHVPDPILRPLGHQRSADGPAGLVSGLARPVIARVTAGSASARSLPLRHRRTGHAADGGAPDAPTPTDSLALDPPAVLDPAVLPDIEPRRAPVVTGTPSVAPRVTQTRSLTSARMAAAEPTPAARSGAAATAAAPTVQRAASTMATRHAPLSVVPSQPIGRATAGATMAGAPTPAGSAAPAMRTILRSPTGSRVRLGPPLSRSDAPLLGSRPTADASGSAAAASPPSAPTVDTAPGVEAARTTGAGSAANTGTYGGLEPAGLVLARVVTAPDPGQSGSPDTPPASRQDAAQADGSLVGSKPLSVTTWPPVPAAGAPGADAAGPSVIAPGGGRAAFPVSTRTTGTASSASRAIQRSSAHHPGGAGAAPAAIHGAPRRGSTTGPNPQAVPFRLQRTAAATSPHGPGSVAGTSASSPAPLRALRSTGTGEAAATAQRAAVALVDTPQAVGDSSPPTPMRLPLQRDAGDGGDAANAGNAGNAGDAGDIAGGTPAISTASAMPERDLETIAHKLYPRLLRRLSSELLVARERAGMLVDHH